MMTVIQSTEASWRRVARAVWAGCSVILLETVILGLALTPVVACVRWLVQRPTSAWLQILLMSLAFVPLYLGFSLILVILSALSTRVLGWRTPANVTLRLTDFSWPVLDWGRYLMTIHVVRVFAGPAFRSTPFWSFYMRLNGAQIGHLVFVNSLSLMDHNLLAFDDGVVIGSDAHVSGHIVEHGLLKTAPVRLGANTVIGIGSVLGIGVESGPDVQVGALSVVPKFTVLEAGVSYAGAPVQRLH
jgi:acetyltransferase-like isoleucine patch superfamily enzyme